MTIVYVVFCTYTIVIAISQCVYIYYCNVDFFSVCTYTIVMTIVGVFIYTMFIHTIVRMSVNVIIKHIY